MKIKVFASPDRDAVITEKEYQERFDKAVDKMTQDDIAFDEWLNDHYSIVTIWHATPEERKKVWKEWREYCQEWCIEDDDDIGQWKEFELEV